MNFEEAHGNWLQGHLLRRTGERRGRLERGHIHGERLFLRNVWWPLVGHFDCLHPEYEVLDWRGKPYFVDLAWLPGHIRLVIEIKGFGPHVRDMDRKRYCEETCREAFMQGIGYIVVSFAYDDVAERPELCMTLLRMIMGRFGHGAPGTAEQHLNRHEKEAIRFAIRRAGPIRPLDLAQALGINHRTAVKLLRSLSSEGWFKPMRSGDSERVCRYELVFDKASKCMW
ncbi:hypothetical protein [Paenibacillus cymbidii]|uniref:hypothetical protein n=1 Tax=Paenibacillus cymbidii TaxID=1639034 RepID=UPI00107FFFBA|nr:hypothetical protein [Paenibacillus cymbidii]